MLDLVNFGRAQSAAPPPDDSNRDNIPPADGTSAAIDGAPGQGQYGPNNEKLPEALQAALLKLGQDFEKEQSAQRRARVRYCMKKRLYWAGNQYLRWNNALGSFDLRPGAGSTPETEEQTVGGESDAPTIRNMFRTHGKSIGAALSAQTPTIRPWPVDASNPDDVETAEAASNIQELFERNNGIRNLQVYQAFLFWTDGMSAGYTRYRVDGTKYGYKELPILEQQPVEIQPDSYQCANPSCPEPMNPADTMLGGCASCGGPLGEENFVPAITGTTSVQTGTKQIPEGQEVVDLYGHLEVELPYFAASPSEFPFIFLKTEYPRSLLKQTYAHIADKITAGAAGSADDEFERIARQGPKQDQGAGIGGGDDRRNQITLARRWFAPWAFQAVEDKTIREQLTALFPSGCYAAFCGNVYAESRDERLSDHWTVAHAEPGTGQIRGGLGDDLMPLQDEKNMVANFRLDAIEHGIPFVGYNQSFFSKEALSKVGIPGAQLPMTVPAGQRAADAFCESPTTKLPAEIAQFEEGLDQEGEFFSGDTPALRGDTQQNVDTASGYQLAVNQAKGRLTIPWIAISEFWAEVAKQAFECFRTNRQDDVKIPLLGDDGEWKSKLISRANLRGNVTVRVEPDSEFPMTWMERSANYKNLLTQSGNNAQIAAVLSDPANLEAGRRYMGLPDIEIPGMNARRAMLRKIEAMEAGMPAMVDPLLDDLPINLKVMQEFYTSADGYKRLMANPEFMALFQQCAQQTNAILNPPMMPMPGGASPDGGKPGMPMPEAPPAAPPVPN